MPRSKVIEIVENGIKRRLGTLLPDKFPIALAARDAGMKILTDGEIRGLLSGIPAGRGFHGSRDVYDPKVWIVDQQQTSSCNGQATAVPLAKAREMTTGVRILLSGGDAYAQMNGGQDSGSTLSDGLKICTTGIAPLACKWNSDQGIPIEQQVQTTTIFGQQISAQAKAVRKLYRGHEPLGLDTELELATFVILYRLAIIAVQAGGKFSSMDSDGVSKGGNGPGNHAVHVDDVRLRNGNLEFDSPNSWGIGFGSAGRIWLRWDEHLRDCVRNHRFWGLPSTALTDAHQPPKPK